MNLEKLGWNNYFEEEFRVYFNKGLIAGRIVSQQKNNYLLHYEKGIIAAKLAGKFRYNVAYSKDLPAIGGCSVNRRQHQRNNSRCFA